MESFHEMLLAGGHANSLGRAEEVLRILQGDSSRLPELFECISAEDPWVRMRAIDTFEKLVKDKPELAKPYLEVILSELTMSNQPSVQWHISQILAEVPLNDSQRNRAISWLKQTIATTDVDWIVATNTMKALLHFHSQGFIPASEITPLLEVQVAHHSKSVRRKAIANMQSLMD